MEAQFPPHRNRRDADGVVEVDSESASDDSRSSELSRSLSKDSSNTWDSISEDLSPDQGGSWSYRDRFGDIYLDYFETCSLNWRMPLTNKVSTFLAYMLLVFSSINCEKDKFSAPLLT